MAGWGLNGGCGVLVLDVQLAYLGEWGFVA